VHDHAEALIKHRRQERAIKANCREKIQVERTTPFAIIEHGEAARWRRRPPDDMNDDIDAAKRVEDSIHYGRTSLSRRDVCGKELGVAWKIVEARACNAEDSCPILAEVPSLRPMPFVAPVTRARHADSSGVLLMESSISGF
jgi:hypothetical protein